MEFDHSPRYIRFLFSLIVCLALLPTSFNAIALENNDIKQLDRQFQSFSNQFYQYMARNFSQCGHRARSLKTLNQQIGKLAKNNKTAVAMCLIHFNHKLISNNIDSDQIFGIFSFLLDNNNLALANRFYSVALDEGDKSLLSNIAYIYARYYLQHKDWKNLLRVSQGIYADLPFEQANQARLYTGIALQKLKKHRKAVKVYQQIPPRSHYYAEAMLNIATAYIRQDWWTDAHIMIQKVLDNKNYRIDKKMRNRLYLVMAYSFLHQEYYRNSRQVFHNIELDSQFANRALLGVALTAMNQKDFIGALNAINILKAKKNIDLSVDESRLLLPYIYEKLGQMHTASASYADAQKYYEQRIAELEAMKIARKISPVTILNNPEVIQLDNNLLDDSMVNEGFIKNIIQLQYIKPYIEQIENRKLKNNYQQVMKAHQNYFTKVNNTIFNNRIHQLNSYMNQARYGIARLFDNSSASR